jgi:Tfp pilus assembly protein PilV
MTLRKAFTLMEVNLAILVMAGGILSIVGLYSLGYRESRQSREDVAAAAFADAVFSPIVSALSATNLKWSAFRNIPSYPSDDGWANYFNRSKGIVDSKPDGKAQAAFSGIIGKARSAAKGSLDVNSSWPSTASGGMSGALVVMHDKDSAIVRLSFRATKNTAELMAMPIFYTEVRFQGLANE